MKHIRKSTYFKTGLTAFIVIAASLTFYYLLFHTASFRNGIRTVLTVLSPLIYGMLLAYILNPVMQLSEKMLLRLVRKMKKETTRSVSNLVRFIAILLSVLFVFLIVYFLAKMLIPELISSIQTIIRNYPVYEQNFTTWINEHFNGENASETTTLITQYADRIYEWMLNELPDLDSVATIVTQRILGVVQFVINLVLGLFIAFYILQSKDVIAAKGKRLLFAFFPIRTANRILHNLKFVDEKFGGFIIGKVIDSGIIGVICYICMQLLKMPFPSLVAVVIGITNIIPFLGPLIGAIPCAILIFVIDPFKALTFVIFIFALQQFDGNILGPYILGSSTGLSSLLVIIAIIISNNIFGLAGAFIGVPVFATVIGIIQSMVRKNVNEKHLPKDLAFYGRIAGLNEVTGEPVKRKGAEGNSLYDRIKRQDPVTADMGVSRFLKKEDTEKVKKGDLPEDPVNISEEEALKNRNIPIVR